MNEIMKYEENVLIVCNSALVFKLCQKIFLFHQSFIIIDDVFRFSLIFFFFSFLDWVNFFYYYYYYFFFPVALWCYDMPGPTSAIP